MQIENKNYKDSVFKPLFNNKIHLLELYNALNSTSYSDPNDLEITTLEGYTLMNVKNDVSFIYVSFSISGEVLPSTKLILLN